MRSTFVLMLLALGCSGDDESATDTGDTDTDTDVPATTGDTGTVPDTYPATWDGVQQLFVEHCDVCHPSQQDVDLHVEAIDFADPYALVVPGDPDNSYLWQVVSGASLLTMPQGGLLPAETVQCIHDWIAAGASTE